MYTVLLLNLEVVEKRVEFFMSVLIFLSEKRRLVEGDVSIMFLSKTTPEMIIVAKEDTAKTDKLAALNKNGD